MKQGQLDALWEKNFQILKATGDVNGDCNVPSRCIVTLPNGESENLGFWLRQQRRLFQSGKILPSRRIQLQSLIDAGKLNWEAPRTRKKDDCAWNKMLNLLGKQSLDPTDKKKLSKWISRQRALKKNGKLSARRELLLNDAVSRGVFEWDGPSGHVENDGWNKMLRLLVEYGECHCQDCNLPSKYTVLDKAYPGGN